MNGWNAVHTGRLGLFVTAITLLMAAGGWRGGQADVAATRLAQDSPALTDLIADKIEITQSMQDLNNSVPLVEAKRTFVRFYAHSTNGIHPATATLKIEAGALQQTLLPIAPGGPLINVRPSYNRALPAHAFLFELPLWATFVDQLSMTAEVNPDLRWRPRNPQESSYANNSVSTTATFDTVPKLHLVVADQPYTFNGVTYTSRPYDRWKAVEWLSRVYPLSQVKAYFRSLPILQAKRKLDENNNWAMTFPYCEWLDVYLAYNRAAILGNPFIPKNSAFLGVVWDDPATAFMRGCAYIGGILVSNGFARSAAGPVGASDWGWDFDGSYADWYSAHEVGHAFGRPHVRGGPGYVEDGCGGEAKAVVHNPNGRISPTVDLFDPNAVFGFDSLKLAPGMNPIIGPNWVDIMTYCDYQWMSKTTYIKLKEAFEFYLPQAVEAVPEQAALQEVLAVFGTLDMETNTVTMLPIQVLSYEGEAAPPAPGPYAIVLRGADGNELARYPFMPGDPDGGPAPGDSPEEQQASIAALLPTIDGLASLEIEAPTGVIYQTAAGLSLPAVQITAPNGGEVFGDESITVTWNASDEDGDTLTYNVYYSADNGASWEPAALFVSETQATIEALNLPASDMALFRVSASDGLHTSSDQSDGVFFIANHPPSGEIIVPAADTTIALDQTISFEGQVYDNDLGALDEANLQWWSDRDGLLGNGAVFTTASLSEGLHEITLVADDGAGQHNIDQVIVIVVSTPNELPAQPDTLTAGPDLVFIEPSSGIASATIYLDNLNLGNPLAWTVTADAGWVILSATSGSTPQELSVTTSLTARDFGVHKALLTFSDPDGIYAPVYIVVVATMPEYRLFVPVVGRE